MYEHHCCTALCIPDECHETMKLNSLSYLCCGCVRDCEEFLVLPAAAAAWCPGPEHAVAEIH